MGIIQKLFPQEVICVDRKIGDISGELYHEEQLCIAQSREKRKREFIAGRLLAREALRRLDIYNFPVQVETDRTPVWPRGIIGSISHAGEYCGVALARKEKSFSLGLDIEQTEKVEKDVWERICTLQELSWINSLPIGEQQKMAALFFSGKECFYKCQYPVSQQWLNFCDVEIDVNRGMEEFTVKINIDIRNFLTDGICVKGKYLFHKGYVFTGITIRAEEVS